MEDKKEPNQESTPPMPPSRKPYVPPEVRPLGRMSDRTLGIGGSRIDPGHNNNIKHGLG
jgi:hypothetical protein